MKQKKTKNNHKIIYHLDLISCGNCGCYKQMLREIDYFADGQIVLDLICDVCGVGSTFDLFDEGALPQIKTKTEPDVRQLVLKKIQTKRLREVKREEKKKIKQVIK